MVDPCESQPILCAGALCACVDPNQHFETDLLGMDHAGTIDCEDGTCRMKSKYEPLSNEVMSNDENTFAQTQLDPYGYSP